MTSHNGVLSSIADEVFVLAAPYVAFHPFPARLPLLPKAHLFHEAGALNGLSKKTLQTGKCNNTTIGPPPHKEKLQESFVHRKLQNTTFITLFLNLKKCYPLY